jgi:hypothetical protein
MPSTCDPVPVRNCGTPDLAGNRRVISSALAELEQESVIRMRETLAADASRHELVEATGGAVSDVSRNSTSRLRGPALVIQVELLNEASVAASSRTGS